MKLEGYVEHIIYQNSENGYCVFQLIADAEVTCVGSIHGLNEGEYLELDGDFVEHAMYGEQLKITNYERKQPKDLMAIERYLGSGAIKGVGAALAARMVRRFGEDTLRIVEEEPERLAEIKGISEKKAREIATQVEEKRDFQKAMIFLQEYGISVNLGAKIYQQYGERIYSVIRENPYRIADDIPGVGFKIADEIATQVGIRSDSDFRVQSGILYTLLQGAGAGHTCLPKELLIRKTKELLGVAEETIEKHLMDLGIDRKIVEKPPYIYASGYYYAELSVAAMLFQLQDYYEVADVEINQRLAKIEKGTGLVLDEQQQNAVKRAARNGIFILTGGPGTGKTTTINTMIQYFESEGLDIFLAAPTGRAAKRMTEATGYEARTIHRLLEVYGGAEGDGRKSIFNRNEENPLETDVIIIDEMSMVDIHLMQALLKAIVPGTRLILVGDVNQLPSVGPGRVLQDIIESEKFPVEKLTRIFRQAAESDIVVNAHKINRGEKVTLNNKSKDFFFLNRNDSTIILRVVLSLLQEKLPRYVDAKPFDVQVLTPMRKGALGVENLNEVLQQYMNPKGEDKAEKEHAKGIFREGDKVMQIKNNYQIEWEIRNKYGIAVDQGQGVFNGDMGVVCEINHFAETLSVEFDEKKVITYSFKQLEELELAYAVTVHKSQGSEYPAVILPLLTGPRPLMNRNLLYTAVTRAKNCVTVVGNPETFQMMVENETEQKRYSGLTEAITTYLSM